MTQEKLEHFKNRLKTMEQEILDNIQSETAEEENPFEVDGDLADKAEAFSSATVSEGLSSSQKKIIEEIRRAYQRMKDGLFGKCIVCNSEIEMERLEAIPYADKCKKHMNGR